MTEWSKVPVLKSGVFKRYRGFESLSACLIMLCLSYMKSTNFFNHLKEMKAHILSMGLSVSICFSMCYYHSEELIFFMTKPLLNVNMDHNLIFTNLHEAFFSHLKLAFYVTVITQVPIALMHIYFFLKPGLYLSEMSILRSIYKKMLLSFSLALLLAYYVIIPLTWAFFTSFQNEYISLEARISDYISLSATTLLVVPFISLVQICLFEAASYGLISVKPMIKFRRPWILCAFLLGTLLSPPDVYSQLLYAVPLVLIYEATILKLCFINTQN